MNFNAYSHDSQAHETAQPGYLSCRKNVLCFVLKL